MKDLSAMSPPYRDFIQARCQADESGGEVLENGTGCQRLRSAKGSYSDRDTAGEPACVGLTRGFIPHGDIMLIGLFCLMIMSPGPDSKISVLDRPPQTPAIQPTRTLLGKREVYPSILHSIGETPLVHLSRLFPEFPQTLYGKLECSNPGGSIKDRTALNILERAMQSGELKSGSTVIESSSGNMAIGLAQACRYWSLKLIVVVDPKINNQTLKLLEAYGAEIHQVTEPEPGSSFLEARISKVKQLLAERPNSFWSDQYHNIDNPGTHRVTMKEILRQLQGQVDYVFAATSTCGTLMGCADYLCERQSTTKMIAVDAKGSVIFGASEGERLIPGHGAGRKSNFLVRSKIDQVVHVSDRECVTGCRELLAREAILAGGSSGGVVTAVQKTLPRLPPQSSCVMIFSDRGERYLDTVYNDEWVSQNL